MFLDNLPILSMLIWVPILGGIWTLIIGDQQERMVRHFSFFITGVTFLLSAILYYQFDNSFSGMQFIEEFYWIEAFGIKYHLGVDGIALPLIMLTTFTTVLVVLAAWEVIDENISYYMCAFLVLTGLMNGVFVALDSILFYVFWESMLIPMFLIIGIWGGANRVYATIKFFLYTFLGSVFMLVALLYLYSVAGSFNIQALHEVPLELTAQKLIFIAFFLAFAVKIPMWPVHTWLPDAHVEAPTGGSVILAATMLKMGGYGFLRFSLPIAPDASLFFANTMIVLSLIAIVYIGFVALVQEDMKKLIAYSSISHMGFVTLGFFIPFGIFAATNSSAGAVMGMEGAMMQMISHGFISAALFLCVGMMYERLHSRMIKDYGGVVNSMPCFAAFMMLFAMANSGLPGTSGFVGEFLVILSSFKVSFWIAFTAALTLILGAAYTLWMYKRVIFGEAIREEVSDLKDIDAREGFILFLLASVVLLFGVWPAPIFDVMHVSIQQLIEHISQTKLL